MPTNSTYASHDASNDDLQLIIGAPAIAKTLGFTIRRVYQMSEDGTLPGLIKLGKSLAIRRSRLIDWLHGLEAAAGAA